jgi:hypothetical protein
LNITGEVIVLDSFLLALALKMVTSAAIVVAASLIVERAGPFLGAMIATLPVSAGPAYVFLAYEHGPAFIERSSLASLVVNAATAGFIAVYAALAQRHRLLVSLGAAIAFWLASAWLASRIAWSLTGAIALNAVAYGGAIFATRRFLKTTVRVPSRSTPWWAVAARAVSVMTLVAVVIAVGRLIGPQAAGIAALMPVVMTSLALVLHPSIGGPAAATVMVIALVGMIGFTAAIVVLHLTSVPFGSVAALTGALATCLLWNGGLTVRRRWLAAP